MTELQIDMNVKVTGGKYKHCVGVLKEINAKFCKVELTRNEKNDTAFSPIKLQKVKKDFVVEHPEPLIVEMPTENDIKVVEHFPGEQSSDIMELIDNAMKDKEIPEVKTTITDVSACDMPVLEEGQCITENHVIKTAISMSEAEKLKDDNDKLRETLATYQHYKIDEIIRELADLRVDYKNLYEEWSAKDVEIIRLNKLLT